MKKNNFLNLLLCLALPLSIGAISGFATVSGVRDWYVTLQKPIFNPPNYLFAPVWTSLYLLMGISFYMILRQPPQKLKRQAIIIFLLQLLLNFLWSFLFFKFQMVGLAVIEIVCLWFSILTMIGIFYKLNRRAGLLQIPYLLWVSFATLLNTSIWVLN